MRKGNRPLRFISQESVIFLDYVVDATWVSDDLPAPPSTPTKPNMLAVLTMYPLCLLGESSCFKN